MPREVKLNELAELLEEMTYPVGVTQAKTRFDDVTLVYADGTEQLSAVLDRVPDERFESAGDAQTSIMNIIPVEGVGEPGQSEGEG
ncbi:DUF5789 family protein [Haloarcula marina]|uniref:DUF5789 family protein n=1 Tax=Haloarcula marina TaxID=2961574 RepID=UPI0020B74895|nr:hypothetical protein [Halomicroarcula marina]